ncbi:hypothetical protein AB0N89_21765 [Amycolatopsis sp. NPDC089917]|uniref:hypothetical protein n=1 Tax=Amycolatopsis sp. NPDC089917 TaxID=3155187 RepID=UPI00344267C9
MALLLLVVVAGTQAGGCLDGHGEAAVEAGSHDSSCPPSGGHLHPRPLSAVAVRSDDSPSIPDSVPPPAPGRVFPGPIQESPRPLASPRSGPRILAELCVSRT